jgi:uncharacterized protein (DUF305 family)
MRLPNAQIDRISQSSRGAAHRGRRLFVWLLATAGLLVALPTLIPPSLVPRVAAAAPGDDSAEAGFARDMATHHAQAVEMAFIILERGEDSAVRLLATDILATQQHQIGQMYAWLELWGLPQASLAPAMAWMGHPTDAPMPGMASRGELRHLASLPGPDADREFLRLMIRHHQGGAPMAQAILNRSDEPVVTRLAQAIVSSQTAEVRTMEAMLATLGGSPAASPEVEHDPEHDGP